MGFFGKFGRVLAGKPVFVPEDVSQAEKQATAPAGQPNDQPEQANGPKLIPVIRLGRVENHVDGNRIDIYADVHNETDELLYVDQVLLLGNQRQLDTQLRAGQSRQLLLYSGPLLANRPEGYAELRYRTASDRDYFANYHEIRSRTSGDHGFEVTEFVQRGPVKDLR